MFKKSATHSLLIFLTLFSPFVHAESGISSNNKEVVLEITGKISVASQGDVALIDRQTINTLPQKQIITTNHLTETPVTYRGPLFRDVLNLVGASGDSVLVTAWDEYMAEINLSDLNKYDVILATHENDQQLTIEGKGPLFVVFPFSDNPEIRNDLYYNKSVWQIKRIEVQ